MKRKITITSTPDNISDILKDYSDVSEYTIELEIEESKDLYKKLSSDSRITDWDLKTNTEVTKVVTYSPSTQQVIDQFEKSLTIDLPGRVSEDDIINSIKINYNISNINELTILLESIFSSLMNDGKKHFSFGKNFIEGCKEQFDVISSSPVTLNHALIKNILEMRYNNAEFSDILKDVISKVSNEWTSLRNGGYTLSSWIYKMFKTPPQE